jgi:hypothetical protein
LILSINFMYMFIRSYSSILQNTRGAELAPLEAI